MQISCWIHRAFRRHHLIMSWKPFVVSPASSYHNDFFLSHLACYFDLVVKQQLWFPRNSPLKPLGKRVHRGCLYAFGLCVCTIRLKSINTSQSCCHKRYQRLSGTNSRSHKHAVHKQTYAHMHTRLTSNFKTNLISSVTEEHAMPHKSQQSSNKTKHYSGSCKPNPSDTPI